MSEEQQPFNVANLGLKPLQRLVRSRRAERIRCGACTFSHKPISGGLECRFDPPKVFMFPIPGPMGHMQLQSHAVFPPVAAEQTCGKGETDEFPASPEA